MEACEVEPLEERTSETRRRQYGNSSTLGNNRQQSTLCKSTVTDLAAAGTSAEGLVSPTEYEGKL